MVLGDLVRQTFLAASMGLDGLKTFLVALVDALTNLQRSRKGQNARNRLKCATDGRSPCPASGLETGGRETRFVKFMGCGEIFEKRI